MPALKRFTSNQRGFSDISDGPEPGRILNEVLAYTNCSLESLAILGVNAHRSCLDENLKGSLKAFKILKTIDLPSNVLLMNNTNFPGSWLPMKALPTEDISRLVDVLPASVETVRLGGEIGLGRDGGTACRPAGGQKQSVSLS